MKRKSEFKIQYMPIGMSIGISVGLVIGASLQNISICMSIGLSIGLCVGVVIDYINNNKKPLICQGVKYKLGFSGAKHRS